MKCAFDAQKITPLYTISSSFQASLSTKHLEIVNVSKILLILYSILEKNIAGASSFCILYTVLLCIYFYFVNQYLKI